MTLIGNDQENPQPSESKEKLIGRHDGFFLIKGPSNEERFNPEDHEDHRVNLSEAVAVQCLREGARIQLKDAEGWRALKIILERGSDNLDEKSVMKNQVQWSPGVLEQVFFDALENGDDKGFKLLLETSMALEYADEQGETALFKATRENRVAMVQALLEKGADVNTSNQHGVTPLMLCAQYHHAELMSLLLSHEAWVDAQNHHAQQTALIYACAKGYSDLVGQLLSHGCDTQLSDKNGKTAWDWVQLKRAGAKSEEQKATWMGLEHQLKQAQEKKLLEGFREKQIHRRQLLTADEGIPEQPAIIKLG